MIGFDTLYSWVRELPIVDWHNHLDLAVLAENKPLGSLYEVWVKADPYKHRAMRICGEPERVITGDASEDEKWAAWTRTLPKLVGNPLFAWAKMELEKFKVESGKFKVVDGEAKIENVLLSEWTPSKILKAFNVEYLSPCVGAECISLFTKGNCHNCSEITNTNSTRSTRSTRLNPVQENSADSASLREIKIAPSLRMNAGDEISVEALEKFDSSGCRVVDISVDDVAKLDAAGWGHPALPTVAAYAAAHGWTMLLHLGALRETSARLRAAAGPAGGFAGMRAPVDPAAVAAFLNELEAMPNVFSRKEHKGNVKFCNCGNMELCKYENENSHNPIIPKFHNSIIAQSNNPVNPVQNSLPRTILMSLNPEAHASLAVLAGSFNGAGLSGKVQLGPAWWWCDHEEGIRDVLEKNAAYGVLSTFVGMTTDSRSLLSLVRHDYFRRILCKWVAEKVASGSFPDDESLLRPMLENMCYRNAKEMVT